VEWRTPLSYVLPGLLEQRWLSQPRHRPELGAGPGDRGSGQLVKPSSRDLFRQELPRLVAEVALLVVITNAKPPELWFSLVLLSVNPGYRIERFLAGGEGLSG